MVKAKAVYSFNAAEGFSFEKHFVNKISNLRKFDNLKWNTLFHRSSILSSRSGGRMYF